MDFRIIFKTGRNPKMGLTKIAVDGPAELVDGRWDLEALVEHGALALQAHVFGPTDESGHVTLGENVLAWNDGK